MSQKKVDAYKKEKANRDKIIKREKRILLVEKTVGLLVCLAAVCWIGYSVYSKVTANQEVVVKDTVMDTSALDDYVSGLTADEEAEDTEAVTDAEETAAEDTEAVTDAEEAGTEDTEAAADAEETGAKDTETVTGTEGTDAASAEDTADAE